jgi:hypothetical protein
VRQERLFERGSRKAQGKEARESHTPAEIAKGRGDGEVGSAVSPFAKSSLRETCAYCGREIGSSGCIIPDFEELGSLCSQDCADGRFRVYLENEG